MKRSELEFCYHCDGVILPCDDAEETGDGWLCEICLGERETQRIRREAMRESAELQEGGA